MDARIRFTKKIIRDKLIELLENNHISKISVTMVCNAAEINRTTFYKYYDNTFDLLVKIERELLDSLQERIIQNGNREFSSMIRIVMEELKSNAHEYQILFSKNSDTAFRERVFSLCYAENMKQIQKIYPNLTNKQQEWLYDFILEGSNGILNQWINGGMEESIDSIVEFTCRIVSILHTNLPTASFQ